MSFPLNPVNGQQAVVNGIKYNYTEATNSWRRDFNNVLDRLFLVGQNEAYATNTSTGDLVVYGGGQFGKSVVIKSNLTVLGTINGVISTATQAISLLGGSPGALVYQSNTNTTAYIPIASTGSILLSNGVIPVWTASAGISVYYSNTATNIAGGNQYEIPYQALAGITAFSPYLKFDTTKLYISTSTSSVDTTACNHHVISFINLNSDDCIIF
jgi:hypothetical protein